MSGKEDLERLRDDVSRVTIQIIRLCGERFFLARKIGEIKAQRRMPVEDSKIEANLKKEVLQKCRSYGVDTKFALDLLDLLLDESKRVQRNLMEDSKNDKQYPPKSPRRLEEP